MEAFRHEVSIADQLVLVDHENELPAIEVESETEDYVVADGPLDIRDLIEDAVLLALPMVPRKPGLEEVKDGGSGGGEGHRPSRSSRASRRMIPDRRETWPYNRTRSRRRSAACTGRTTTWASRPIAVEPTTGETHLRHHISPSGFYRGKKVVQTKD